MIDINELRRLAQAATPGPWGNTDPDPTIINSPYNQLAICYRNSRALTDAKFIAAANPAAISELLDRLEAAESDGLEQARLLGMGGEREAALMAKLEAAEKERDSTRKLADSLALALNTSNHERDNLRAKIELMERQEQVAWMGRGPRDGRIEFSVDKPSPSVMRDFNMIPLYALPGAKGE